MLANGLITNSRNVNTSGIYARIYQDFISGKVRLPSLPDVVFKIRDLIRDPNASTETIARIIQADPGLTAYLVKVANSPFFLTRSPAKDIKMSVRRLGLRRTRDLVTSYVLRTLYEGDSRVLKRRLNDIRQQSIKTAAISYVLARSFRGFEPDRVMLAGLLQDIGAPALLIELEKRPEIANDESMTRTAVSNLTPLVGALLLQHWQFENDLIDVARSREDWMRDPHPQLEMADIVLIARLHSYIGTPWMSLCPRISEVPAFAKMPLDELTPRQSLKLVEEAHQDILELECLLGAS